MTFSAAGSTRCPWKSCERQLLLALREPDTLDWAKKQDTVYTPQAEFGDLTGLATLPQVRLQTSAAIEQPAGASEGKLHIRVKNPSTSVAFQTGLRLANRKDGLDACRCSGTNDFSLLPGEERMISVRYDTAESRAHPVIQVGGFNIAPVKLDRELPTGCRRVALIFRVVHNAAR